MNGVCLRIVSEPLYHGKRIDHHRMTRGIQIVLVGTIGVRILIKQDMLQSLMTESVRYRIATVGTVFYLPAVGADDATRTYESGTCVQTYCIGTVYAQRMLDWAVHSNINNGVNTASAIGAGKFDVEGGRGNVIDGPCDTIGQVASLNGGTILLVVL